MIVINGLEVIKVDNQHTHRVFMAQCLGNKLVGKLHQAVSIMAPGQLVGSRKGK